jgi:ATP-dependent Clp protease ATP-binding subunit ClpC
MIDGTDFAQVLAEADDIAISVGQKLTSAHLLLALFTVENRAQLLLKERGIDEDRLLGVMTAAPRELEGLTRELCERSREIAKNCGALEADCLHFLIATTRVRCAAQDLLMRAGLDLTAIRNTALSYQLSGRMPRKLKLKRAEQTGELRGRWNAAEPPASVPKSVTSVTSIGLPQPNPARPPAERGEDIGRAQESAAPDPREPNAKASFALDPKSFPLLSSIGRNLSLLAQQGRLDPVIGRSREIEEVIDVLGKRRANNPCLVGEPGVGKTAVVEGVAQRLQADSAASDERIVVELEVASLVAGTQLRGSFSERLKALKEEVKRGSGRVVVFIDEIHMLVGAGASGEGPQDAANELKSAMSRGDFPCIGATTHDEFRKFIGSDPALERRFVPVLIKEPSVPETLQILSGVIARYEEHHRLKYTSEALQTAASLAAKYVSDRFLPDKAISIADLAGSRCRREAKELVEAADVARIVAKLASIPEERLLMTDSARLLRLDEELSRRVIGHREALGRIAQVIRRNYAGFATCRPMGSFLFFGPTGVGKTEVARALAEALFGSRDGFLQLDMSELSEAHGVSRLIGAPAGYVGYGEGGQLTEPVRRRPSSVVVFDEIEKAHHDALMLLLQILEEGRLTDGKGRHIDFSNTVVILTSNLGAEALARSDRKVGFGTSKLEPAELELQGLDAVRKMLPPELWNRIDERLGFGPLSEAEVSEIAQLLLGDSSRRLASEKGIEYVAGPEVVRHLLRSGGFDPQLGARPMRQTIQRMVEGPLAEKILAGEFAPGDRVRVVLRSENVTFLHDGRTQRL